MTSADFERVLDRATDLVDRAHRLTEALRSAEERAARAEGELAYWQGRARLMARALLLWKRYDCTPKGKNMAQTRAYCDALSATETAMADFRRDALH